MTKLHRLLHGHDHARDGKLRRVSPTRRAKLATFARKNRVRLRPTKRTAMPGNNLRQLAPELAQQKPKFPAIHALLYSSPVRKTTKQLQAPALSPLSQENLPPFEDSADFVVLSSARSRESRGSHPNQRQQASDPFRPTSCKSRRSCYPV
jgi:hypothetical protein